MQDLNDLLSSVHYLNHPLLSGLSALLILLMGIFVLSRDRKSELYRTFFWITLVMSIWFFGNALSMFYFNNFEYAFFWFKFGYTTVPLLSISYYHFYLAYFKKEKRILYSLYIIGILEIIYLWLFSGDHKTADYVLPNVGVIWRTMSPIFYFLLFGMVKYIILSTVTTVSFLNKYRKETALLKKQELKYLTAVFFVTIFGTIEWLVIFGIPLHIAWPVLPVLVGLIAYAILKYQLMNIKIIIKKAFFYSVGIALAGGIIMAVSFLSSWFTERIPGFKFWTIPLLAGTAAFIIGNIFWRQSKEVDKLKYEFITVAAHKLRTPLTEIKWAADVASDQKLEEKERQRLISQIEYSANRLIDLSDELLQVAQTESGQFTYKLNPEDLEEIAREEIADMESRIREKNIKLTLEAEKNIPKINIDRIRISSVIQSLLENAVMYTKDQINISIRKDRTEVIFSIKDNGMGVSKDDQPYIFSKLYRAQNAYLADTEGSGINLFLAKSIVEKHGGKINVNSEGAGKGSEFWFKLKII